MLRRLRLLAEATGTYCEAVSRRGKTIASCNPGYYAEMTWSAARLPITPYPDAFEKQYRAALRPLLEDLAGQDRPGRPVESRLPFA